MASLRPKRTAVKSAPSPKRRQAAAGDTSSETEVRAEAKEALARLVLTKRQELQSIRHQAKVQQLAQLRRRLQEQKVAGRSSKAASLEDLKETDVAKQREESCRRLRQTLLQSLNNKDDEESEELSETLVVLESDAEPTRDAKKRMLEEERQPVQLKAASKAARLVAAKPLRLTPRKGS